MYIYFFSLQALFCLCYYYSTYLFYSLSVHMFTRIYILCVRIVSMIIYIYLSTDYTHDHVVVIYIYNSLLYIPTWSVSVCLNWSMVVVSHDCRSCRVVMLAIYDYVDSRWLPISSRLIEQLRSTTLSRQLSSRNMPKNERRRRRRLSRTNLAERY